MMFSMRSRLKKKKDQQPLQSSAGKHAPTGQVEKKYAAGVPLPQLVPRSMVHTPELVVRENTRSFAAETFRRLKSLLSVNTGLNPQVIVVTSPIPGEGKSLISINLALAFGGIKDGRALLIDADLRRPTQAKWLNPKPSIGLADLLQKDIDPVHAVLKIQDTHLDVLPAGAMNDDPGDLLASNKMQELMEKFRNKYLKIVVDTPPIVPFTDADIVAACGDGILLVVRNSCTKISAMRQAETLLKSAPLMGLILNDQSPTISHRGEKYDSYYREYYLKSRKR